MQQAEGDIRELYRQAVRDRDTYAHHLRYILNVEMFDGALANLVEQHVKNTQVVRKRMRIKKGWGNAGQEGVRLGIDMLSSGIVWTPVKWAGDVDPSWHKTAGLEDV